MKLNKYFMLGLAGLAFAACSNEDEGNDILTKGTKQISVTISAGSYGQTNAGSGWTEIFIYPGYKFKAIDGLITNFHLPESTLLMLVSALAGKEHIMAAYEEAVKERYRFFSFGDAMMIE